MRHRNMRLMLARQKLLLAEKKAMTGEAPSGDDHENNGDKDYEERDDDIDINIDDDDDEEEEDDDEGEKKVDINGDDNDDSERISSTLPKTDEDSATMKDPADDAVSVHTECDVAETEILDPTQLLDRMKSG